MTYGQAMDYIEELGKLGSVMGLASMENLCEKLGNPQQDLSFIHIAGTNGKGSVLAFLKGGRIPHREVSVACYF